MNAIDRSSLRRSLRLKRKSLSLTDQATAAFGALNQLLNLPQYQAAQTIGLYWAADSELDPSLIAAHAAISGKTLYLPVVKRNEETSNRYLEFRVYTPGSNLILNSFGIPEPDPSSATLAPADLDLLLVPLVGIDRQGNRLGMGGGFYDATFAYKQTAPSSTPCLVGLAHDLQLVDTLVPEAWDVKLDALITDSQTLSF